jgi:carbon-monoxide dehydrogenase medium subunit
VIPAEFEYTAPATLKEAVERLAGASEAKILAGGMSLIPALKHRLLRPSLLVDLGRVPDLDGVSLQRGKLVCGARATHAALAASEELAGALPVVRETARVLGDPQVRSRGTIGGSLVHADPAADWSALFLALDGEAKLVGPRGERSVRAADFFTGMLRTALGADEILAELSLRFERKRAGSAYEKMRQPASGFAVVGVAAQVVLDRKGRVDGCAVALTGVNPVPFRAAGVEERVRGCEPTDQALREACAQIEELDPMDDLHASSEYRRHLASVYARRALARAAERARA